MAIGLALVSMALALLLHQAQVLRHTASRVRFDQDLEAVSQLMRTELRRAGLRQTDGPSPAHDRIVVEGASNATQVHYRSDTEATSAGSLSTLRLSAGGLQHRTPATGSFQGLHDQQTLSLSTLSLSLRDQPGCGLLVDAYLLTRPSILGEISAQNHNLAIRRRNHGPMACEGP